MSSHPKPGLGDLWSFPVASVLVIIIRVTIEYDSTIWSMCLKQSFLKSSCQSTYAPHNQADIPSSSGLRSGVTSQLLTASLDILSVLSNMVSISSHVELKPRVAVFSCLEANNLSSDGALVMPALGKIRLLGPLKITNRSSEVPAALLKAVELPTWRSTRTSAVPPAHQRALPRWKHLESCCPANQFLPRPAVSRGGLALA
jgi:hypothetical protein